MPRSDHYPPDIMDKHQAFASAILEYFTLVEDWEVHRFDPSQPRVPAGQSGGGQWTSEGGAGGGGTLGGSGSTSSPAMALDRPAAMPVAHRPLETPPPVAPTEVVKPATTAQILTRAWMTPTYIALFDVPKFVDVNVGVPRSTDRQYIGPPDATRPGVPYGEASRFETLKDMLPPAPPNDEFHHIVEQAQYQYFTDRPNDPRAVHNTSNIVILDRETHICVTSIYARLNTNGVVAREALRGKPYSEQYEAGLRAIAECKSDPKYEGRMSPTWLGDSNLNQTPFFPPILPPRIFGRMDQRPILTKTFQHPAFPQSTQRVDAMPLDIIKLQEALEAVHDVEIDNSDETVAKSNHFKLMAFKVFRAVEKTEADWEACKSLLVHPFSTVRVWIALQFLEAGRKEGWSVLLKDAVPGMRFVEGSMDDRMRNFQAKMAGHMYMTTKFNYLASLDLSPSIGEMEARWIAEGKMDRPFPRFP